MSVSDLILANYVLKLKAGPSDPAEVETASRQGIPRVAGRLAILAVAAISIAALAGSV